jgi:hypothetical protein
MQSPIFSVSDAVAVLNQTLDYAYPTITIVGEISSFNVSKGKWLYFDIKDDGSKLKCFGTVFQLKMPIEDGMMVELIAKPKLHNLYDLSERAVSKRLLHYCRKNSKPKDFSRPREKEQYRAHQKRLGLLAQNNQLAMPISLR